MQSQRRHSRTVPLFLSSCCVVSACGSLRWLLARVVCAMLRVPVRCHPAALECAADSTDRGRGGARGGRGGREHRSASRVCTSILASGSSARKGRAHDTRHTEQRHTRVSTRTLTILPAHSRTEASSDALHCRLHSLQRCPSPSPLLSSRTASRNSSPRCISTSSRTRFPVATRSIACCVNSSRSMCREDTRGDRCMSADGQERGRQPALITSCTACLHRDYKPTEA